MATGHYIQRKVGAGAELHMATDPNRDQSYFLFSTTPEQLDYLRFPLGHLASKAETRALAARYGLAVADKPDSQDICFVPNGNYAAVIEKLRPGAADPGEIVDLAAVSYTHLDVYKRQRPDAAKHRRTDRAAHSRGPRRFRCGCRRPSPRRVFCATCR